MIPIFVPALCLEQCLSQGKGENFKQSDGHKAKEVCKSSAEASGREMHKWGSQVECRVIHPGSVAKDGAVHSQGKIPSGIGLAESANWCLGAP